MTPGELALMRTMLREELAPIITRVEKLEGARKEHSGQFRAVTKEQIPLIRSEAQLARKGDNEAIGVAFDRMAVFMNDLADTAARIEKAQQPLPVVAVSDGKGGTSVHPASIVAAESSVRTENTTNKLEGKADAIQVAANRSDTQSLSAARWAKLSPLITVLTAGVCGGIWKFIEYLLHL